MKISGRQVETIEIEIDRYELSRILMSFVLDDFLNMEGYDDAGCDWLTDNGCVYLGTKDWLFSSDNKVATLIDAMNIIKYGKKLTLQGE